MATGFLSFTLFLFFNIIIIIYFFYVQDGEVW